MSAPFHITSGTYIVYQQPSGTRLFRVRSKKRGAPAWTCDEIVNEAGDRIRTAHVVPEFSLHERGEEVYATSDGDAYKAYRAVLARRRETR